MLNLLKKQKSLRQSVPLVKPRLLRQFSTTDLAAVESVVRGEDYQVRENIPRGKNRPGYDLKVGDVIHGAWSVDAIDRIDFFDINAYRCSHLETGAKHIHLDC